MIVLGIYLLFFVIALALVVMVFRRLRPRGLLPAAAASMFSLCGFALFFPIPIHGGFTFPREIMLWELEQSKTEYEVKGRERKHEAFERSLEQRFSGVITDYEVVQEKAGWAKLSLPLAWLDRESGLIWLPPQPLASNVERVEREAAEAFCRRQVPKGYWALPTEAEMALLWQHGGHHIMPGTGHSSAALLIQQELQVQMLTQYRGNIAGYALRCVAISRDAPRRGYIGSDLPLSLWNRFQLNKVEIYSAATASPADLDAQRGN